MAILNSPWNQPELDGGVIQGRPDGTIECLSSANHWNWDPAAGTVLQAPYPDWGGGPSPSSFPLPDGRILTGLGDQAFTLFHPQEGRFYSLAQLKTTYQDEMPPLQLQDGRVLNFTYKGVRFFDPQSDIKIQPAVLVSKGGDQVTFAASGDAAVIGVTWSCVGGGISDDGIWTAPFASGLYRVIGTSKLSGSKSSSVWIQVPKARVLISAPKTTLAKGEIVQLSAVVVDCVPQGVIWNVPAGSRAGSITKDGLFTAGAVGGVYTVEAISKGDSTCIGRILLTVQAEGLPRNLQLSVDKSIVAFGDDFTISFDAQEALRCTLVLQHLENQNSYGLGTIQVPGTKHCPVQLDLFKDGMYSPWVKTAAGGYFNGGQYVLTLRAENEAGFTLKSVLITILDPRAFEIPTKEFVLQPGGELDLTVAPRFANQPAPAVNWSASSGSITPLGRFTAPSEGAWVTITAAHSLEPGLKATTKVNVTSALPQIVAMNIQQGDQVPLGTSINLGWNVYSASTLKLDASTGESWDVTSYGSYCSSAFVVTPTENTTYTLTATNPNGSVTAERSIALVPVQITVSPISAPLHAGGTTSINVSSNYYLFCSIEEPEGGSVYLSALYVDGTNRLYQYTYQAPSKEGTYHLVFYPLQRQWAEARVTLNVLPYPSISIIPKAASTYGGLPIQFGFDLAAPTNQVEWSPAERITQAGLYTAPVEPGTYTVTVKSVDDPTKSDTAIVTVLAPEVSLTILPETVTLSPGQCLSFGTSIQITGGVNAGIGWSCDGGTLVGKGASAFYAAPLVPGIYKVTATSLTNTNVYASAIVQVSALQPSTPTLSVLPFTATLNVGQRIFLGTDFGVSDPQTGLDWTTTMGVVSPEITGASAFFTAPSEPGTCLVTVKGHSHSELTNTVALTVVTPEAPAFSVVPSAATLATGQSLLLEAVDDRGKIIETPSWTIQDAEGGVITPAGLYTAPLKAGTYRVMASDLSVPSRSASATLTVVSTGGGDGGIGGSGEPTNHGIAVAPDKSEIAAGTYQPLSASVAGLDNQTVSWTVENAPSTASVDSQGVFMANAAGTYRVFATSTESPSVNGSSVIKVVSSVKTIAGPLMNASLHGYSVTALKDGRVLIAGGYDGVDCTSAARVYDPETKEFTATAPMTRKRAWHTSILLDDGRVLIVGGWAPTWDLKPGCNIYFHDYDSEIFNPATGAFESLPSSILPEVEIPGGTPFPEIVVPGLTRFVHFGGNPAVKLGSGQVLVLEGRRYSESSDYTPPPDYYDMGSDLFNPATSTFDLANWESNYSVGIDGWGLQADCFRTDYRSAAVTLDDGGALITGGYLPGHAGISWGANGWAPPIWTVKNVARIYSEGSGVASVAPMCSPRAGHTMTKLSDGRILIVGGYQSITNTALPNQAWENPYNFKTQYFCTSTAEIYDPATGVFTPTGSMSEPRSEHAAILLPSGQVLIVGGMNEDGTGAKVYPKTTELYDPNTGTFSQMDHLDYGLEEPKMVLQGDGHVFLMGTVKDLITPQRIRSNSLRLNAMFTDGPPAPEENHEISVNVANAVELVVHVCFDKYWRGQGEAANPGSQVWLQAGPYAFDFKHRGGDWQNAEFIKVLLEDLDGNEVKSVFTNSEGKAHFPLYEGGRPTTLSQTMGRKYRIKVISEYEIKDATSTWVKGVIYPVEPGHPHEYRDPNVTLDPAQGLARTIKVELISTSMNNVPNSGQRIAGAFNIVWMLDISFKKLREVESATGTPVTINIQWAPGVNPGTKFSVSQTPPYLARIDGDRSVNSDEFDDAVLGHEFGHFVNTLYGQDKSLGGNHKQKLYTYDPCLAFSEGWASFFQAVIRSQGYYQKSNGLSMSDAVMFDTGNAGISMPTMKPDDVWPSLDFTAAQGWCNEFSVFRLLWKLHTKIFNGDFSKSWEIMKSFRSSITDLTSTAAWVSKVRTVPGVDPLALSALLVAENFPTTPLAPYEDTLELALGNAITSQKLLAYSVDRGIERQTTAYYAIVCDPSNATGETQITITSSDSLDKLTVRYWADGLEDGAHIATNLGGGKWVVTANPGQKNLIRLWNTGSTAINYSIKCENKN